VQLSYFGSSGRQLLGLYNPPSAASERDAAVLLCHPAAQEYMRCHWALRQLALRLAGAGFHVFRFDYFGTGDSAGGSEEADLEQWRRDVGEAIEELKDVSGVRRPSLVGLRLGATLAAQTPARLKDLVLWEPVVSGPAYLGELRAAHLRLFGHCLPPLPADGPVVEALGHPLPPAVQAGLEGLALEAPLACSADRVLVVSSEPVGGPHQHLAARLAEAGAPAAYEPVPDSFDPYAAFLLTTRAQERIAALLSRNAR
jgi:pimeloyl-ACP methyl ester carboxylesterase